MAGKVSRAKAPDYTQRESAYLNLLAEQRTSVRIHLTDNQTFEGTVEFFDTTFIGLTRDGAPNLFLFKQDIKYLVELEPPSHENTKQ